MGAVRHTSGSIWPVNMKTKNEKKRNSVTDLYGIASIGFEFLGFLALPAIVGYFIDTRVIQTNHGSPGVIFFLSIFIGFGAGLYFLIRAGMKYSGSMESHEKRKPDVHNVPTVEQDVDRIRRALDATGDEIDRLGGSHRKRGNE